MEIKEKEKKISEKLSIIAPNNRAMILAYDQGFEHGPRDFLVNPDSADFEYILEVAQRGGFTGLVVHAGLAEKYEWKIRSARIPLIIKLNGKSEIYANDDPYSPQLYSVDEALNLGATAVGYTVYTGSKYENQMNLEFARIIREAHTKGIPVVGWMYPRGKSVVGDHQEKSDTRQRADKEKNRGLDIDETPSMVAYAARIGLELGADIVKIKYTGSVESFRWVVKCAGPTKVVMSGGAKTKTEKEFFSRVNDVLEAGGIGIAVGRNVWQRKNSFSFNNKLRRIILGQDLKAR